MSNYWEKTYSSNIKFNDKFNNASSNLPWDIGDVDDFLKKTISKVSNEEKSALDIGCGYGHDTNFISSYGYDTIGIDISQTAINKAKEIYPTIQFEVSDILSEKLTNRFDLIYDRGCFHNFELSQMDLYFSILSNYLKPNGKLVIITGNYNDENPPNTRPTPISLQQIEYFSLKYFKIISIEEIDFKQNGDFGDSLGWGSILKKRKTPLELNR